MPVAVELTIILVAIGLGSFVKGVTGSGLPQVAIPVMAVFLGVERAVVLMALPGVVANGWLLWRYRSHLRTTRDLPVLLATGIVGAILGTVGLRALDAAVLSLVLAGSVGLYLALVLSRVEIDLPPGVTRVTSPAVGFVAGALQGATGMSAPLLTTYFHALRLHKYVYIVSLVTLFQVFALTQMITLFRIGLYTDTRFLESVIALVPVMLVVPLGARLTDRLSGRGFDTWVLVLLAGSAAKLLYDGIVGLT